MNKLLLAIGVVAGLLSCRDVAIKAGPKPLTFTDKHYGYTFNYDDSWKLDDSSTVDGRVVSGAVLDNEAEKVQISVQMLPLPSEVSLQDALVRFASSLAATGMATNIQALMSPDGTRGVITAQMADMDSMVLFTLGTNEEISRCLYTVLSIRPVNASKATIERTDAVLASFRTK